MTTRVFTIGFTKTTAERFFSRIRDAGVKLIVDVRLNNSSQLAGFAKSDDLKYFAREIANAKYAHVPDLAPTQDILDDLKKRGGEWEQYETRFLDLMSSRKIEKKLRPEMFEDACLLCSEDKPHHCHRRLVVEYLNEHWNGCLSVKHL